MGRKVDRLVTNASGYVGYKPSTSAGGARSEKMVGQIGDEPDWENLNKTHHPDMGCSGNLSPTVTVHPVNVGTSCPGRKTGLAAADVGHGGRSGRSSLRHGKHVTWRRATANREFGGK